MPRKNQKLINYHSSGANASQRIVPANLEYGEIAVGYNQQDPQLIIRTSADTVAVFVDSAGVETIVNNKMSQSVQDLNDLKESVSSLTENLTTLSSSVQTIETDLNGQIDALGDSSDGVSSGLSELSGYVENNCATTAALETEKSRIDTANQNINTLSGAVSAIRDTYATSANVNTLAENVYASANSYTDQVSGAVLTEVSNNYATTAALETEKGRIDTANQNINTLSGAVSAIRDTYATSANVNTLVENVYSSANSYTNQVSGAVLTEVSNNYATTAALETEKGRIDNVIQDVSKLSGVVDSMETDLTDYIDERLTVVYKFKGTVNTYADLASITEKENGDVYNVISGNGTTPPGTNYAWNVSGGTSGEWDALGGSVDLSNYATTAALEIEKGRIDTANQNINTLSGAVSAIRDTYATSANVNTLAGNVYASANSYTTQVSGAVLTEVSNNYATKDALETEKGRIDTANQNINTLSGAVSAIRDTYATSANVNTLAGNVYASANSYTNQVSGAVLTEVSNNYATKDALETEKGRIDTTIQSLSTLSGRVDTIEPKANEALQGFAFAGTGITTTGTQSEQSGAIADFTSGGNATLNLNSLVIDCGDF